MAKSSRIFKVTFYGQNSVYELYAKGVRQSDLLGFLELSDLVFGSTSEVVVDPSEERLKMEFGSVKTTYVPMHAVLRVDEVEKEGVAKIRDISTKTGNNIAHFPISAFEKAPTES